jgi:hypothetical protein
MCEETMMVIPSAQSVFSALARTDPRLGIETGSRLIQHHENRVVDGGLGNGEALAQASGSFPRPAD